jgi:hypothetical protein
VQKESDFDYRDSFGSDVQEQLLRSGVKIRVFSFCLSLMSAGLDGKTFAFSVYIPANSNQPSVAKVSGYLTFINLSGAGRGFAHSVLMISISHIG